MILRNRVAVLAALLFFMPVADSLKAQGAQFTHDTVAYANRLRGGEAIANDSIWDTPSDEWDTLLYTKRLNFPFYAMGYNLDTFLLEDGYISSTDGNFSVGNFSDLVDKGLGGRGGAKSPISLHRFGSAPNRIVMLQWANHGFYGDFDLRGQCSDSGNMQMWIYETGGKIELRFGKNYIRDFASSMADFTFIGYSVIDGPSFTGMVLEGNPNRPSTRTTDLDQSVGLIAYPPQSKRYTWTFDASSGVKKTEKQSGLKVWYSQGLIYMKGNETGTYELYDGAGKCVEKGIAQNRASVGQTVKPGLYLLRVNTADGSAAVRISVLH